MPYTESEKLESVVNQLFVSQKDLSELLSVLVTLSFSNKSERVAASERIRSIQSRVFSLNNRFPYPGQFVLVSSNYIGCLFSFLLESLNFCDTIIASSREEAQTYASLFSKGKERFYQAVERLSLFLSLTEQSELKWYSSFNRTTFEHHFKAVWKE